MDSNGTATMSRYARTPLHASSLTQNALVQHDYHTMPIGGRNTIPNYAGHIPGAQAVFAQRRALASFHASQEQGALRATGNLWTTPSLCDLRPEHRSQNKNYYYAEMAASPYHKFGQKGVFDKRR